MNSLNLWENGWLKREGDIYILKMIMPFPLKENNCFLAESDEGWVLIDTGVNLVQNQNLFINVLDTVGISFRDITAVYLTHYHHDHSGLAGWLQTKADLPVYLPEPDLLTWQKFIDTDTYLERAWNECKLAGWPEGFVYELADNIRQINTMIQPYPLFSPLNPSDQINVGGLAYETISIPGHSDGHYVFHSPVSEYLFSGDNVVDHTILHITDWPHTCLDNPCDIHLSALNGLRDLPIRVVLPGHGKLFSNLESKIELINIHHRKRKASVLNALQTPMTAWEVAKRLFGVHDFIHIRRLVLAETLAYLDSLVNEGLVEKDLSEGMFVYHPCRK